MICLYYKEITTSDRWILGDRYVRTFFKRAFGYKRKVSSLQKVFNNLCTGFDRINTPYIVNKPFSKLMPGDIPIVLGRGKNCLEGYNKPNRIIAGIGLVTHPSEWPTLFEDYPVKVYLQHSDWNLQMYNKYYPNCKLWQAGIDTEFWKPNALAVKKTTDILIYEKVMWDKEAQQQNLINPIISFLASRNLSYSIIKYGSYDIKQYKSALASSNAMIFLCEHESQGLAYQEAMSMNVPIIAWQQGLWLDPNKFKYGEHEPVKALSVPFFDDRCGETFSDLAEFNLRFDAFFESVQKNLFNPRQYILENLSLEKSARKMLQIVSSLEN